MWVFFEGDAFDLARFMSDSSNRSIALDLNAEGFRERGQVLRDSVHATLWEMRSQSMFQVRDYVQHGRSSVRIRSVVGCITIKQLHQVRFFQSSLVPAMQRSEPRQTVHKWKNSSPSGLAASSPLVEALF